MAKLNRKRCCVPNCDSYEPINHAIPREERIRAIWLQRIGNNRLTNLNSSTLNRYLVCNVHFADLCKNGPCKLLRYSLPTINLPGFNGENTPENCFSHPPVSNILETPTIVQTLMEKYQSSRSSASKDSDSETFASVDVVSDVQTRAHFKKCTSKIATMENKYNPNKVCRTCLSTETNLKCIFDIQMSRTHSIRVIDFIRRMTSIKIAREDGLPQNLCEHCIETICKSYNFSQQCVASDSYLKQLTLENKKEITYNQSFQLLETDQELDRNDEPNLESQSGEFEHDNFEIVEEFKPIFHNLEIIKEEQVVNANDSDKDKEEHQCQHCQKCFTTKLKLTKHELLHNFGKLYECKECFKMFPKKTYLISHMRSHVKTEDKPFECNICSQRFAFSHLLKQHSFKHAQEKPFPCTECNKGCLTAESLRRHMRTHDENYKKKQHVCPICSKEYPYPSFLAEHMKNHTGEKPYLCSICGKSFRQNGALEYHIRSHTGFKPYKCQICNNDFTSRGGLRVHMRRHTNERPYACDICGVAFRQLTDLKSHHRTHTGDKRAVCNICGKHLSTKGQLTVHIRSHTGEKPFECDICKKKFSTRTILVKHIRIHTGEKPYMCNECGRSFSQSSTLKTHCLIHKRNCVNPCNTTATEKLIFELVKGDSEDLKTYKLSECYETQEINDENTYSIIPISDIAI